MSALKFGTGMGILVLAIGLSIIASPFVASFSQSGFHFYSPSQDYQSYRDGQSVILDFTSPYPNSEFTVIVNQVIVNQTTHKETIKLYNSLGEFTNSTGGFYGPIISGEYPIGQYLILIEDPTYNAYSSFNISITPSSYPAYIEANVEAQNGTPISGANVQAKAPNGTIVANNVTGSNGVAYLQVQYPLSPINYTLIASANGYKTESAVVDVNSNTTFPVTLKLPYIGLYVNLTGIFQNGKQITNYSLIEGQPVTLEYQVIYQGKSVSNVEVGAYIPYVNKTLTALTNSNGLANITFTPPLVGKVSVMVNASAVYNNTAGHTEVKLNFEPTYFKVPINVKVTEENGSALFSNISLVYTNGTKETAQGSSVVFNVSYDGTPEKFMIYASSMGFVSENKTILVNGTQPVNVTLALPREYMNVSISVAQNGTTLFPPYHLVGGVPFLITVNSTMNGEPVPATLSGTLIFYNGTTKSFSTTLSSGSGQVKLVLPKTNTTAEVELKLSYDGVQYSKMFNLSSLVYPTVTTSSIPPTTTTTHPSTNYLPYIIIGIIIVIVIVAVLAFTRRPKTTK
ncbi:carboxypeptidase-like regulatory domain-containing protein [Sulfuracidifex tepidarius]|uniref:Carboxypeptidase regulatory-like domain-containing protein n=1 Tax=Sulfuracidifex tepidarius TaxID=1294262 RepID=A0A510E0G8_9CREN|nr:carboxypeptidase-like regulatory domain-containing protein [Sulfuracidifex tepidarius]BBG22920.1 hypothetical protein IC006_0204 [Sulfuracidifex tepidarius]BBG25680.1 hypothetical protein IC007_0185 [Sulfuracidifex tepidarius]